MPDVSVLFHEWILQNYKAELEILLMWPIMTFTLKKAVTCRQVNQDGNYMQIKEYNRNVNAEASREKNGPL